MKKKVLVKKKPPPTDAPEANKPPTGASAANPFGAVLKKTPDNVCFYIDVFDR